MTRYFAEKRYEKIKRELGPFVIWGLADILGELLFRIIEAVLDD